jgi:hypothetical protein
VTMRLLIDLPEAWKPIPQEGFLGVVVEPDLVMEIPDLHPVPEDVWSWSRGAALRDVPPEGAEIEITNMFDPRTALGWPIAVYESEARDGDAVVEARIHAVFAMIEYGSIVVARARDRARLAARRDEILGALETARPDWGDDPRASLRDLLGP